MSHESHESHESQEKQDQAPQRSERLPLTARIVEVFLTGNLPALLIAISLLGGALALLVTPREEDPQISVPLADVLISVPGSSAHEVERQVASRLEKLLYEVDGVEYVYSMSRADQAVVTVRFYVGEDREDSLVKLYNKISMNRDRVPPQVAGWVVKPVTIDDVPIVAVALYGDGVGDDALRRVAEEIESNLKEVENTGRTAVIGGRPRKLLVRVDPQALAARGLGWRALERALAAADVVLPAGGIQQAGEELVVEGGALLTSPDEVRGLVISVADGAPVYLEDVAAVELAAAEPESYTRIGFGPGADPELVPERFRDPARDFPSVTIAIAKRPGANAVWVAEGILARLERIEEEVLPAGVHYRVIRNYGETANDKVNELVEALGVAIVIVVVLIAMTLGWREGFVVATAVPITFSLTLLVNYLAGYTINRVTLFALILALGLVVDDPIVDVENIYRHLRMRGKKPLRAVLEAVNEVRPPIILATLAVIISFLPMFFITGMMGPYMRPMALNVPLAMLMSLVVAFTITPWMSYLVLKGPAERARRRAGEEGAGGEDREGSAEPGPGDAVERDTATYRVYRRMLDPLLGSARARGALLAVTLLLFGASCWLGIDRRVPLKMLPYDNKNELQVVLDMPEGTTLEETEGALAALAAYLRRVPEVTSVATYAGIASPLDFNGMVRHYYLRSAPHLGDLRVNVVHKQRRVHQSHELALRLRRGLTALAEARGATIAVVEMPPGPPVLATLVAEVYGAPYTSYADVQAAARTVAERLEAEPAVVDIDTTVEAEQRRFRFEPDRAKVRLTGVSERRIARAIRAAVHGVEAAVLHDAREVNPTPIEVRLGEADRRSVDALGAIAVATRRGQTVQLSELGRFVEARAGQTIYRKNLERVVYVTADLAGRPPAEAILDVQADRRQPSGRRGEVAGDRTPRALAERSFLERGSEIPWSVPPDVRVSWRGEGEWKITLEVFRDLGLAFAAACVGIYILLVHETGSYLMPLILMIAIPLTVIGIMPGFWLLNAFTTAPVDGWKDPVYFTATAMIGMIALAGIAVRNAILLIEFVHYGLEAGKPLREALIDSGAVRFRPIFLTAGTAMLAAWPITLDPIFSGLAWALIFGLLVSTAFTLLVIPVVYYMVYRGSEGAGGQPAAGEEAAA